MKSFFCLVGFYASLAWSDSDQDYGRFDCYPEPSGTESLCTARGCIWDSEAESTVPRCYYPPSWGYSQIGSTTESQNGTEISYHLSRNDNFVFPYSGGIEDVTLQVTYVSDECLRLRYLDMNNANRYEVPIPIPPRDGESHFKPLYKFSTSSLIDRLFSFDITRASTEEVVLSSENLPGFVYSDQFLQFMVSFSNETQLYGWGERYSQVRIPTNVYTTLVSWSRDILDTPGYGNSYGVHPFLMGIESSGDAFGIFILNSNAMELVVTPFPALQYRTIGGIIDVFVFFGPSVQDVIQQYWHLIGHPALPPFWSLGFHLCRWGYNTLNRTRETVEGMVKAGVPYDTQWNDIDYMDGKKDFTYDPVNFAGLPQFVDNLHEQYGMHYVMIVDPAISNASGYTTYEQGLEDNVFMLNDQNEVLLGEVWPGVCAFPDFFKNSTKKWWSEEISSWHQVVDFDGLWIDMNEPSNFVNGQLGGCSSNTYDDPPYFPAALLDNSDPSVGLATKTACMAAQQGDQGESTVHYNVHSLYGHSEAIATSQALRQMQPQKRPFILSRSTYSGSGQFTGHWLGDNTATFLDMQISMSGVIAFNMYGIPLVGADICGFLGNTSIELCTRWMEIGSFYPFSRNHNGYGYIPQDPVSLGEPVTSVSRKYLTLRYQLLPYLYTLFYRSSEYGELVVKSIWLVDDWLKTCLTDDGCMLIEEQFLWGDALLISPALYANQTRVTAYFPMHNDRLGAKERWFELTSGAEVLNFDDSEQPWQELDCPLEYLPLHIRGGFILPMYTTKHGVQTTTQLRQNPFQLLAAFNTHLNASGQVFMDDGESADTLESENYVVAWFNMWCDRYIVDESEEYLCELESIPSRDGYDGIPNDYVDSIVIYGLGNGYFMYGINWATTQLKVEIISNYSDPVTYTYDNDRGVLIFNVSKSVPSLRITEEFYFKWYIYTEAINDGGDGNGDGNGDGDDGGSGSNSGKIAGIVIGVVVGVLLAFGVVYFFLKRREQHRHPHDYVPVNDFHAL